MLELGDILRSHRAQRIHFTKERTLLPRIQLALNSLNLLSLLPRSYQSR